MKISTNYFLNTINNTTKFKFEAKVLAITLLVVSILATLCAIWYRFTQVKAKSRQIAVIPTTQKPEKEAPIHIAPDDDPPPAIPNVPQEIISCSEKISKETEDQPAFPKDLCLEILNYLEPQELEHVSLINENWAKLTQEDQLWKKFANEISKHDQITLKKGIKIKEQISSYLFDFGFYLPNKKQFVATRQLSNEDCKQIIKRFPNTYMQQPLGSWGGSHIWYHLNGNCEYEIDDPSGGCDANVLSIISKYQRIYVLGNAMFGEEDIDSDSDIE